MVVQKVSVNSPNTQYYGAMSPAQNPQLAPNSTVPQKKDYSKAIAWTAAGLATAGLAGVLIYNARKGKTSGGTDSLAGVGTYLRKFLDDSIFAKSAEDAKNNVDGVIFKASEDGNDFQLANIIKGFGCRLVKKVPEGQTGVPNFEFGSGALNIRIFNKDADTSQFNFILGSEENFKLSMEVDSWRGKIKSCTAKDSTESYKFSDEQCKEILDKLDLKKLIDDDSYRAMYTNSFLQMVGGVVRKTKFQKIADKSGKSLEEIAQTFDSKEFDNLLNIQDTLAQVQERYNLSGSVFESGIYKGIKGKDQFAMLEDYVMNESSRLKIVDDVVEQNLHFPSDKTCFDVTVPTADGAGIAEQFRFSHDGEYCLYKRVNPDNTAESLTIETYYPELNESNSCRTLIETKDASFFMDSTLSGKNRVEITRPDGAETIKFDFNSKGEWNEGIDYADELQPYMGYIEKLSKLLSDDEHNWEFIRDFATRGKDLIAELAKVD